MFIAVIRNTDFGRRRGRKALDNINNGRKNLKFKHHFIATLCCATLATAALAQTQAKPKKTAPPVVQQVVPDTLADLKAEFEYREKQLAPYLKLYAEAEEKKMACVKATFDRPLSHAGCNHEDRKLTMVAQYAEPFLVKREEAKDAYEREQRKADRLQSKQ